MDILSCNCEATQTRRKFKDYHIFNTCSLVGPSLGPGIIIMLTHINVTTAYRPG